MTLADPLSRPSPSAVEEAALDRLAGAVVVPGQAVPRGIVIDNPEVQRAQRRVALLTIVLPAAGTVAAVALTWWIPLRWSDLALLALFYGLTSLGVTVGFHRHFSHRSFKARPWLRTTLGILGCMSAQGTIVYWVATHRRHHQYSEGEGDPHSPYLHEGEALGFWRGLWHSHLGWMIDSRMTNTARFARDLVRDPDVAWVNARYFRWVALGIALPGLLGGLLTLSWSGILTGALWGGVVRMFLVHHAMWTSGSTAHILGTRPFPTRDRSTNNPALALANLGEAWHNNHHAFPSSALFGLRWWQVDPGGLFIRAAERMGWAWDVRSPTPAMIEAKLRGDAPAPL